MTDHKEPAADWQPVTRAGQVKVGDKLRFWIGDTGYAETARQILHAGTDAEEVIYNKRSNYYFITSMVINGCSNHKRVEVLATPAAPKASEVPEGAVIGLRKLYDWMTRLPVPTDGIIPQMKRLKGVIHVLEASATSAPQAEKAPATPTAKEPELSEKDWLNIKLAAIHLKEAKFHTASDNLMAILARRRAATTCAVCAGTKSSFGKRCECTEGI